MRFLKIFLDFYINSSVHIALSCFALVKVTYLMLNIFDDNSVANFAFFGTFISYNFVKFDALTRANKSKMKIQLKGIIGLSFIAKIFVIYYFLKLQNNTKITIIFLVGLIILYVFPLFSNNKNARNFAGLKIYIVAICWIGVTVVLPILNSAISFKNSFYIIAFQRFFLIFPLILIFEIIDLKTDDSHLKTVPQQIGVMNTKILGFILLICFCGLSFFNGNNNFQFLELLLNFVIAIVIAIFLIFSNENRSKYYTSFWVESIPVLWWLTYIFVK